MSEYLENAVRLLREAPSGILRKGLGRNSALSFAQGAVGTICYFLVYRLLIAEAGTEVLGLWSLTVGIVAFGRLADVSGGAGLSRMVAIADHDSESAAVYIDTVTIATAILYTAIIVATLIPFSRMVVASIEDRFHEIGQWLVVVTSMSLFLNVMVSSQLSALDGLHRSDIRSIIQICGFLIFILLSYALIPHIGVKGMALSQVAQFVLVLVLARAVLVAKISGLGFVPMQFSRKAFLETMSYGIKLQVTSLAGLVFDPLSRIMINHFGGLSVLGIYDLAYKITAYTRMLIVSASMPLIPEFSRRYIHDRAAGKNLVNTVFPKFAALTALAFGMTCLCAPLVSYFVLSQISSIFIINVAVLSIGWYISTLGNVIQLYAQGAGMLRWNIAGQWAIAAGSVIFGYIAGEAGYGAYVAVGVATAVAFGSLVGIVGNLRLYGLNVNLVPLTRSSLLSLAMFIGSLGFLCVVAWR
ncbi:oligosaccharide flippase family protein [Mesorhizobium sp. M0698]|uniref:oligosaccharide flippase family protein n=1 Tax=Mesorhizobium sp. M0698 TaxID=2956987 RepID=UPI00333D0775